MEKPLDNRRTTVYTSLQVVRHVDRQECKALVNEHQLRALLKEHGYGLQLRARRGTGKRYAYARKREGLRVRTRYLCPEDEMSTVEAETILEKLK